MRAGVLRRVALVGAAGLALGLLAAPSAAFASDDVDPFPGVGYFEVIPGYEDVPADYACPPGAGLALIVDIGLGRTYGQCIKTWRSPELLELIAQEYAAYEAVRQAAYEESVRLNTLSPGTQHCVPYSFTWRYAHTGEETGGVCANVVPPPVPPGDDTAVVEPAPSPGPSPQPGPGPGPAPPPGDDTTAGGDPEPPVVDDTPVLSDPPVLDDTPVAAPGDDTVEPSGSLSVELTRAGAYRISVAGAAPDSQVRVVAGFAGERRRLVWGTVTTDASGSAVLRTHRDLAGSRLRLVVDGVTVDRVRVRR